MLYNLNVYNLCQMYLNKAGGWETKHEKQIIKVKWIKKNKLWEPLCKTYS